MGMFNIFKKGFDADVFEKDLTLLTQKISSTQSQVLKLNNKSKYVTISLVKYLIIIYLLANLYNYSNVPKEIKGSNVIQTFFKGQSRGQLIFLVAYPVVSYLFVHLVSFIFKILINKRQSYLSSLKKKHASKIEELKRITNFNTTSKLLNKYGNDDNKDMNQKPPQAVGPQDRLFNQPASLQAGKQPGKPFTLQKKSDNNRKQTPTQVPQTTMSDAMKPPSRTLQDRLLDLLVGSDNNEAIENRFALICRQCFTHNGLAPPGCKEPFKVRYICPNCRFLNGSFDDEIIQTETSSEGIEKLEKVEKDLENNDLQIIKSELEVDDSVLKKSE